MKEKQNVYSSLFTFYFLQDANTGLGKQRFSLQLHIFNNMEKRKSGSSSKKEKPKVFFYMRKID